MHYFKILAFTLITVFVCATTPVSASATKVQSSKTKDIIVTPLYLPLEATLTTNKTTYFDNEVVQSTINIFGGVSNYQSTATYYITYSDSTGYSYSWQTTQTRVYFNKAYSTGNYTIRIRVSSNQCPDVVDDSVSITVR